MVSALKHKGKRLHELARAGIEVERKPRPVTIHTLDLLDVERDRLTLRVDCTKGTYIRSLGMDIGDALGCGAHLTALRRERSGPFDLVDAVDLDTLESNGEAAARARLLPADLALADRPSVELDAERAARLQQGQAVDAEGEAADPVRIYSEGVFLGLGRVDERGILRPRRLFNPD